MNILLIGNPNVGKSALFSQLTGVSVITSNYPGTTVTYTKGYLTVIEKTDEACTSCGKGKKSCSNCSGRISERIEVIDVPGTYRLDPECEAEKVAVDMIDSGDIIVNVVDATNLERNLNLTLQLMEYDKPVILALNMWDETKHKGIKIDDKKLSELLGIPVVRTSGISGLGIEELVRECKNAKSINRKGVKVNNRWERIGEIIQEVQNLSHRHHTFMEMVQDISIHPVFGIVFALVSLAVIFSIIISVGEFLAGLFEGIFNVIYTPFILWLNDVLTPYETIRYILIGDVVNGVFDYETAMGVLTTGIFMTIAIVLPYIFIFYLVFGFLEDLGYMPRIAIIFDRLLHKIGLHGFSIIPMMLSLGCNVPGIMAIRNLESRRERFITAVVASVTIPCMAQTAIIFRSAGARGTEYVVLILGSIFCVWLILGSVLKLIVKGRTTSLIMEIPPYRKPGLKIQVKTLIMRMKGYISEAVPYVLGGIFLVNVLNLLGVLQFIGKLTAPVIKVMFGLPEETVAAFIIGIVRKDAAVALLEPLMLTDSQMATAIIALILYFPCIATFVVLFKELGFADTVKAVVIMTLVTLVTGTVFNLLLGKVFVLATFLLLEIAFAIAVSYIVEARVYKRNLKEIQE